MLHLLALNFTHLARLLHVLDLNVFVHLDRGWHLGDVLLVVVVIVIVAVTGPLVVGVVAVAVVRIVVLGFNSIQS